MKKLIIITVIAITCAGCMTTVGRFVTTLTSGAPGMLSVTTCELVRNNWTGTHETTNCQTTPVGVR